MFRFDELESWEGVSPSKPNLQVPVFSNPHGSLVSKQTRGPPNPLQHKLPSPLPPSSPPDSLSQDIDSEGDEVEDPFGFFAAEKRLKARKSTLPLQQTRKSSINVDSSLESDNAIGEVFANQFAVSANHAISNAPHTLISGQKRPLGSPTVPLTLTKSEPSSPCQRATKRRSTVSKRGVEEKGKKRARREQVANATNDDPGLKLLKLETLLPKRFKGRGAEARTAKKTIDREKTTHKGTKKTVAVGEIMPFDRQEKLEREREERLSYYKRLDNYRIAKEKTSATYRELVSEARRVKPAALNIQQSPGEAVSLPRTSSLQNHLKTVSSSTRMSKAEIQSWIDTREEENEAVTTFQWSTLQEDWPAFVDYAQRQILTSSTKTRVEFLKGRLSPLAARGELKRYQLGEIFRLLTLTYPRYVDSMSREAVELVLQDLIKRDASQERSEWQLILDWLANESDRLGKRGPTSAPANQFVLLNWACTLYTTILHNKSINISVEYWATLVSVLASTLDCLLDIDMHTKDAIRKGAVVRTRRAVRGHPGSIPGLISTLLTLSKTFPSPLSAAPLLGLSVDVALRLKIKGGQPTTAGKDVIIPLKEAILDFYTNQLLMAKTPVPSHISTALRDFINAFVSEQDLNTKMLPAIEKSMIRSPEISMSVVSDLVLAYPRPLQSDVFRRILTSILNGAKSTNATIRSHSSRLFSVLVDHESTDETLVSFAVTELIALPKASKTTGADHRISLYGMLRAVKPTSVVAPIITTVLPSLLAKETSDVALALLAQTLAPHVTFRLRDNQTLESDPINTILREMSSTKPAPRRAFCSVAGNALWDLGDCHTDAARTFAAALLPALETSLKTVSANALTSAAGPLEGYVALAVLLGPVSRLQVPKYEDLLSRHAGVQGIVGSSTKPHFLLWQKCYQKLTTPEEEQWLLRALESALSFFNADVAKSETLRIQFGYAFIYLATENNNVDTRRAAIALVQAMAGRISRIIGRIVRESLLDYLSQNEPSRKGGTMDEEKEGAITRQSRYYGLLSACASLPEDVDPDLREHELVENITLAHHSAICRASRPVWIELCQKARVDPYHLITQNTERLMQLVWECVDVGNKPPSFISAGYRAITTLTFVSPVQVLPRLMEQLRRDLDPAQLESIGLTEYSIWKTPAGTLFVDVLAKKKDIPIEKGKDAELRKWEAELRKSLATKKPANASNLSKQDKTLVEAQLAKEAQTRSNVTQVKRRLDRGLELVRSIVAANTTEFHSMISSVVSLLLSGAVRRGSLLVGSGAFETYVRIADACSDRLGSFRRWIGVSTLRGIDVDGIPDELTVEPLNQMTLRVLYRLRALAEQSPFDAATYSYAAPLVNHVIATGGGSAADSDEALEQLALALDIIRFHCAEFIDPAYPRLDTIKTLLYIIRVHPQLVQVSVPSLVNVGEAIHPSATREETQTLIHGCLAQEGVVRNACLQTLQAFDLTDLDWSPALWVVCHDDDEQNSRLSHRIWEDNGLDVPEDFLRDLLPLLEHDHTYVRLSCAYAFAEAAAAWPQSMEKVLSALQEFYREKAKMLAPEFDEYGMIIARSLDRTDPWPARLAVARTFEALASFFPEEEVIRFFRFLVSEEALGDRHGGVRRGLLAAGTAIVDLHGPSQLPELISMFEASLLATSVSSETGDHVKEAVVILFGRLARHLDRADPRVPKVVERLVDALKTPAESVQVAVSDCLSPLVKSMRSSASQLVDQLFADMLSAPKYAARRGAAYGLAGVIKGTGISGMKEFDIIGRLRVALEDKKHSEARQGVMFAFETLSATLGRLFEPYVTHLLPSLLASFGDAIPDVRDATQDAAKVIMGNMSGYGVKLLLPSLLSGLDEKQWRTKKGSIELLGTMAFCAPTQLSISLPTVIPRLTGVLTDSHAQVRTAANKSLKQFGEVISNPEIQTLVPILLKALVDPDKGPTALAALLKMSFSHYIDSSSLALVIPIIERGLRERSSETKRKAARIVGNMSSLTDPKDFVPYLPRLLPMVHVCLVDPVPEARATAAKALGTLVERLGEIHFPDLVPGLLRTLKADTSGVDRQGAAQGLSEVLSALGTERLEGLLPDIITNASSPRSHVKEGFMSLLVFLPATFGVRFQPHLPKIIQPILGGLADTEEVVRDAALRAGRMIIVNYSNRAIDLLLPELERGMVDPSWRIRQSSITLVGELLFKIAGISGKAEIEDEDNMAEATAVETSRRALTDILGQDRRDRVLSSLYIARQDGVNTVRQSSIHVWKALVQNTPRTVREILPSITAQVVSLLASPGFEQRETAARTMGELCRKLGEKVLAEIISILQTSSNSNNDRTREGACLTLSEILDNTNDAQRQGHEDALISMVRRFLVDDSSAVRSAAARTFDILQETLGAKAIDETIPTLLEALRQPGESSSTALQALKEVMNVRAGVVFPVLIPTLIATPITAFNARALASLVTVAGNALSKRLTVILGALVQALESGQNEELCEDINEAVRALLASIADTEGLNTLMLLLLGWVKHQSFSRRISAMNLFATFCEETELDFSFYRVDWIRQLITSLDDRQQEVVEATSKALDVFVKSVSKEDLESLVIPLRRTIESTGAPGRHVPGFSLPKGLSPLLPIILAGLTTGSNEQREQAAYAIGDLVERTDEQAMKPFVVPMTGPLIRVATQSTSYPAPVKAAILTALTTMLERISQFVKPFFPQLQRTFVKATSDPTSLAVRSRAALGLGMLMRSQPRVDPLVTELIVGVKSNEDAVAASLVQALAHVAKNASANLGQASKDGAAELISDAFRENHDEHYIQAIAALFANLSPFTDLLRPIVEAHLLAGTPPSALCSNILKTTIEDAPALFYTLSCVPSIVKKVIASIGENPSISRPAREAKELLKSVHPYVDDNDVQSLF